MILLVLQILSSFLFGRCHRSLAVRLHQVYNLFGHRFDLLRQQAEKHSRRNVLEQLQESHEGFSVGALAALKQSRFVLGSLADRIRVPDQHIAAIEAALGHHLQLVLTERPDFAEQILADLAANKKGRASIAALGLVAAGVPTAVEDGVAPSGPVLEEAQGK